MTVSSSTKPTSELVYLGQMGENNLVSVSIFVPCVSLVLCYTLLGGLQHLVTDEPVMTISPWSCSRAPPSSLPFLPPYPLSSSSCAQPHRHSLPMTPSLLDLRLIDCVLCLPRATLPFYSSTSLPESVLLLHSFLCASAPTSLC